MPTSSGKFLPDLAADQIVALARQKPFGLRIHVGKLPVPIEREEAVGRVLKNVGQRPGRLDQRRPGLVPLGQVANLPFRDGKPDVQKRESSGLVR